MDTALDPEDMAQFLLLYQLFDDQEIIIPPSVLMHGEKFSCLFGCIFHLQQIGRR